MVATIVAQDDNRLAHECTCTQYRRGTPHDEWLAVLDDIAAAFFVVSLAHQYSRACLYAGT